MSEPYEEVIEGEKVLRLPPGRRHELICERLYAVVRASVADFASTRLLDIRSAIHLAGDTTIRPDLALLTTANNKLWLAAEIVSSEDHHADTVDKKQVYEAIKLPRLWMIDPRYDNIEVYFGTEYGMRLHTILAGKDVLTEKLLPEFQLGVADLFAPTHC